MSLLLPRTHYQPLQPRPVSIPFDRESQQTSTASHKRGYSGPFVFVNSSDDAERGDENRANKTMIKRWAMLNREGQNNRQLASLKDHSKIVTWNLKTLEETEEPAATSPRNSTPTQDAECEPSSTSSPHVSTFDPASFDPFDALPIGSSPHTRRLLQFHLSGEGDESLMTRHQKSNFKKVTWPIIRDSKAALYSLVALLEVSPEVPIHSNNEFIFATYFSTALVSTSALLKQANEPVSLAVFCCTNFLTWVAHYLKDTQALSAHGIGLAALISRQWNVFSRTPLMKGGVAFWDQEHNEGSIMPDFTIPSGINKLDRYATLPPAGFHTLGEKGYISDGLVKCIPNILRMDDLLILAKTNNLSVASAKELLSFIWYNVRSLRQSRTGRLTDLEDCVRQAIVMYLYANIFADPAGEIAWLAEPVKEQMLLVDIDRLIVDCPQAVLWICLVVGPFAKGASRDYFASLLTQARGALVIGSCQEALQQYAAQQFLWTRSLDYEAEQLWHDTT
ncbi:MAG: hypothetical protein M1828_006199 [Chrysothrix sp. TS-e1954]|nr:MAG: hypothetical protein M1828_006199 [Chrysothrix sp. TS-e1954]